MPLAWWGSWAAGYLAVLVFVAVRASVGRVATFCSGRFLFVFTVVFALGALAPSLLVGRSIPVAVLIWIAALVVATWLSRGHALVFGETPAKTAETVADCARRLCLTGERTVAGYRFALPGGALQVRLRPLGLATLMTLRAKPPHRKAELFAKLIPKQYRAPLPVIRIRMR